MIALLAILIAAVVLFVGMFKYAHGYMYRIDENGNSEKYYHFGGKPYSGFKCIDGAIKAFDENGVPYVGLSEINGKTYYFNTSGELRDETRTGFYYAPDGYRYYYNEKGKKVTARWLEIDGNTYYFQPVTGRMLVSERAVIDGVEYVFDENGLATPVGQ